MGWLDQRLRIRRDALMEGHVMGFAVTINFHIKTGTQCVDHRRAHTVQATDRV